MTVAQSYFVDTTFKINDQVLHISTKNIDSNLVLLNSIDIPKNALRDIINGIGLADIEFPDFNNDSYPDILLTYFVNNPTYYFYLFDFTSKHFKSIINYMNFPDAIQLKFDSKYYYSYYHAGVQI